MDNIEILDYFSESQDAERWINIVDNKISNWINTHNKRYWEVVRYVSNEYYFSQTIGREKFGELLVKYCPKAVTKSDTSMSLKYNMDKFEYNDNLERKHNLCDDHPLLKAIDEVKEIFNSESVSTDNTPLHLKVLKQELNKVAEAYPFARLFENVAYCGFQSDFSIEIFVSENFIKEQKPTHIHIYNIINEVVSEETVLRESSKYMKDNRIKLYIVSEHGYDNHVKRIATERSVGLVRIITYNSVGSIQYSLPRYSDNQIYIGKYNQMLEGKTNMTCPIVVLTENRISTSLVKRWNEDTRYVDLETLQRSSVPVLSCEEIENIAYSLVKETAESHVKELAKIGYTCNDVPSLSIDPFKMAQQSGLTIIWSGEMEKEELGKMDIRNKTMYINAYIEDVHRERFTGAHEYGHSKLHGEGTLPVYKETSFTLSLTEMETKRLEFQANLFASCLLMPAIVLSEYYRIYWQKHYGNRKPEPLEVWNRNEFMPTFYKVVCPIARKMNVSAEAMKWRLFHLGLLKCIKPSYLKNIR